MKIKNIVLIMVIIIILSFNVFGALSDNLQIYYSFENSTGAEIDLTNHINATHTSTTRGVSGIIGNSVQGASGSDGVVTDSTLSFSSSTPQTYNIWIYPTSSSSYPQPLGHFGDRVYSVYTSTNGDGKVAYLTGSSNGGGWNAHQGDINKAIPLNSWTMITITITSNSQKLYVNGENVFNSTDSYSPVSSAKVSIFAENNAFYGTYEGKVDEFGLWNRTLNQSEITQLYNNGNGLSYANITAITTPTPINFTYTKTCFFNSTGLSLNLMSGCY